MEESSPADPSCGPDHWGCKYSQFSCQSGNLREAFCCIVQFHFFFKYRSGGVFLFAYTVNLFCNFYIQF